jgi:hypothetical protein
MPRRATAEHEEVRLARLHEVDGFVELLERERGGRGAGSLVYLLAGWAELVQPVEALGVHRRVAVDELVLELVRDRLRLELQHRRLDVLDVVARRRDVPVDVRVAAEDLQRRVHLREGRRRFRPRIAHVEEGGSRHRVLAVVSEGIADHLDERQHLEHARLLDDGLHHALQDDVVRELGGFRQG